MSISETIEIAPMSINRAWQGRRFATKEYKDWTENMLLMMNKREMIEGDVMVQIEFYFKYAKKNDIDNCIKTCLDAIVKKGWIRDDRQVQCLLVCKNESDRPRIEIEIKPMGT